MNLQLLLLLLGVASRTASVRVCKSFTDYLIPFSKNCYDNPDAESNTTQIVQRWNVETEEHRITTEDGYILLVNRAYTNKSNKIPVILAHGITLNSLSFVDRGNKSLANLLVNAGFDVWLVNFRGSKYSLGHTDLSSSSSKFWDFSFHEMGVHDLRSIIEYVYKLSGQKAYLIGYSMGATASFIFCSTFPTEAAQRVHHFISLAPAAYLANLRSFIKFLIPFEKVLKGTLDLVSHGKFSMGLAQSICTQHVFLFIICDVVRGTVFGINLRQIDYNDWPVYSRLNGDAASAKVIDHYSQLYLSKEFQWYDNGLAGNQLKYGQSSPPKYNLTAIQTPVTMYVGRNDLLVSLKDSERTYTELEESVRGGYYVVADSGFAHDNFVNAKDIVSLVYENVVNSIKKYAN